MTADLRPPRTLRPPLPPPEVWPLALGRALVELFWPESCALCAREAGAAAAADWAAAGPAIGGLRRWDRPHLCALCARELPGEPLSRALPLPGGGELPLAAGRPESAPLVQLVAAAKYHGVRGLLWPLAAVAAAAIPLALAAGGEAEVLVPVPLHAARRRQRGFNQAETLAALLAAGLARPLRPELLRRARRTAQQARIPSDDARRAANVAGAFRARPAPAGGGARVGLVDDLATSGQTLAAAAAALREAGWRPVWALVVGAAGAGAAADGSLDTARAPA